MFTTRPELLGTFGFVTSTHWLASQAGMSMLEKGGNAFDAAVATGFVLQVVEPHLNGLGGEVPILFRSAKEDKVRVLCGQGMTPERATIDTYRNFDLELVPGAGLLAAVVPGAFDAWMVLLRDHGTLPLADVLAPAIEYAANGYPLLPRIAEAIANVQELFTDEWPSSASLYLKDGAPPTPNELFRNTALAGTYARLVQKAGTGGYDRESQIEAARAAFYKGFVAQEIHQFCAEKVLMDSSGERHGGLLSFDDMANWSATYEDPLTYDYEGYTVHKTGPWGQGPVFLQQLALLSGFDLGAMRPDSAAFIHTVVECAKLAFADREAYYGDPNFSEVPIEALLSDAYNDERRKLVTDEASFEQRPGLIPGFENQIRNAVPTLTGEEPNPIAGIGEPTTTGPSGADSSSGVELARSAWRYLPLGCHRPAWQCRVRHAERRLVAKFALDSRTRHVPDDARPNVLVARRRSLQPRAEKETADNVDALDRHTRRRDIGLRDAGWRSAGSMVPRLFPASRPLRAQPAREY